MSSNKNNNRLVTIFFSPRRDAWCVTFSYFDGDGSWFEFKGKTLFDEEAAQFATSIKLSKDYPTTLTMLRFVALLKHFDADHRLFGAVGALDGHEAETRAWWDNVVITQKGE